MKWKFWGKPAPKPGALKIGDMVLIRFGEISPPKFECYRKCDFEIADKSKVSDHDWVIIAHDGVILDAQEICLKKIPPPEEGTASWEDCVWRPAEKVASDDEIEYS